MASGESAAIMPLEELVTLAAFEGFDEEDFAVFEIPGFEARMPRLRERIKPKLTLLSELLAPRLSEALGVTLYPHVAQHLRRSVNAPECTWAAFARSPRAYKPFTHVRVSLSGDNLRVLVFIEDDAQDKPTLAANLERNADAFSEFLGHHPTIRAYDLKDADGEPLRGSQLTPDVLRQFAARLKRVKGQHASFGLTFDKSHPLLLNGPELLDALVQAALTLKPLYDCGAVPEFAYVYAPEPIEGI